MPLTVPACRRPAAESQLMNSSPLRSYRYFSTAPFLLDRNSPTLKLRNLT
jgi:hypothetical protein